MSTLDVSREQRDMADIKDYVASRSGTGGGLSSVTRSVTTVSGSPGTVVRSVIKVHARDHETGPVKLSLSLAV